MPNRRRFLQGLSAAPLATATTRAAVTKHDYFKELNVRPFINAAGTYTTLTASLMLPEVVEAIEYASKKFVHLIELHDACAARIASAIGCEAAMITSGAAAALTVGTAACLTGKNQEFIRRLPDLTGMKTEVVVQKSHRYGYDHAVRNCGVRMVEVETAAEMDAAMGPSTAMALFFNAAEKTPIGNEEFVRIAKKHNVPTFNDAAADVPPVEHLSKYLKQGFDLVTFSGGKGIRGPQSAGLLIGRKDLIEAARMNSSPNGDAIGRGLKVNKEELLGMMVAVEAFVKRDHKAEWKEYEKRVKILADSVAAIPSVKTESFIPEISNAVPHLRITWDQSKLTAKEAKKRLLEGEPSIEVRPSKDDVLEVAVWMLEPGEAQIVARRIREVLKG